MNSLPPKDIKDCNLTISSSEKRHIWISEIPIINILIAIKVLKWVLKCMFQDVPV